MKKSKKKMLLVLDKQDNTIQGAFPNTSEGKSLAQEHIQAISKQSKRSPNVFRISSR